MIEIYYFSGTGNSLQVAKLLKRYILSDEIKLISMDLKSRGKDIKTSGKKVGFIFPVYCGDIPKKIKEYLKNIDIKSAEYIFFLPTCHSVSGVTVRRFKNILKKKNKILDYERVVYMPDNAILFPVEDDLDKLSTVEKRVECIAKDIENRVYKVERDKLILPFIQNKFFSIFSDIEFSPKRFRLKDEKCISCGICEKVCPMGNIELKDGRPFWKNDCAYCLACFHWCPKEAVYMKNFVIKDRRRYQNPTIKVEEIIERKERDV